MIKIIYLFLGISILLGQNKNLQEPPEPIIKEFTPAGRIEALLDETVDSHMLLVQLDLKNDSLFNIVNSNIPDLNLNVGPATYHRVFPAEEFNRLTDIISSDSYHILKIT